MIYSIRDRLCTIMPLSQSTIAQRDVINKFVPMIHLLLLIPRRMILENGTLAKNTYLSPVVHKKVTATY